MTTAPPVALSIRIQARLAAVLLPLALAGGAGADTLLVLKAHQDAAEVAGQRHEAKDSTIELWIGEDRISRNDDQVKFVMRPDEILIVDHARKVYSVLALPADLAKLLPPGAETAPEMWKVDAEVTASDERKKIGEWNARRYSVEVTNPMGLAVRTELWASTELDIDLAAYHRMARQMLEMQPGTEELAAEMAKVEGFPVLQETTVDVAGSMVTTREELLSVETRQPPADAYDPPAGYARTELPMAAPPG